MEAFSPRRQPRDADSLDGTISLMSPHQRPRAGPSTGTEIVKVGLAYVDKGRLLTARKIDGKRLILPGGKLNPTESDFEALQREIREELMCELVSRSLAWVGAFQDVAADIPEATVTVRLYEGRVTGIPRPSHEIAELLWFDPSTDERRLLAPSIRNQILDVLFPQH